MRYLVGRIDKLVMVKRSVLNGGTDCSAQMDRMLLIYETRSLLEGNKIQGDCR